LHGFQLCLLMLPRRPLDSSSKQSSEALPQEAGDAKAALEDMGISRKE
jgi:hypothetical protein